MVASEIKKRNNASKVIVCLNWWVCVDTRMGPEGTRLKQLLESGLKIQFIIQARGLGRIWETGCVKKKKC